MAMRRLIGLLGVGLTIMVPLIPSAFAADGDTAEAAPIEAMAVDSPTQDASREHILQEIEATRQTDPELAEVMEEQLKLLEESGRATLSTSDTGTTATTSNPFGQWGQGEAATANSLGAPGLLGPPIEIGPQGQPIGQPGEQEGLNDQQRGLFEQVQADPRMQQVREQFEGGQLSEQQAREKVFEVLRDHGIEPNNGREWEQEGMRGEGMTQEGVRGELGERGEGFERAFERMDPNAREQMERLFGEHEASGAREQEQHETFREMMEREFGTFERTMDSPELQRESETQERMYETPTREMDTMMRETETLERSYETPTYEAPTREYEAPTYDAPTREYEAPTYDAPTREYEAPTPEYDRPQYEYQGAPSP